MRENLTIGFIGNPNCGKTTLFNAYTGANLKVANWPGVTVEKVEGAIKDHDLNIRLVDLPGTYSLTSYTMEEQVSRQFILSDEVDVIIDVADASALERNLYLTLQLLELGKPVVLAGEPARETDQVKAVIAHRNGITQYELFFPWSLLPGVNPKAEDGCGFSLEVVNRDAGGKRAVFTPHPEHPHQNPFVWGNLIFKP